MSNSKETVKKGLFISVIAVACLLAGLIVGVAVNNNDSNFSGLVEHDNPIFTNGLRAGASEVQVINSSGETVGVINTSENATLSGTNTFSGATTLSATTTVTAPFFVKDTASSTAVVGDSSASGGVGPGCLIWGDSAGATSTPVYVTATGATLTATTTKPSICIEQ